MVMYKCEKCGEEHAAFPNVLLAVNIPDKKYSFHRSEFEKKWDEIRSSYDVEESWNIFWAWLGEKAGERKMKWFCSERCAIEYLADVANIDLGVDYEGG